MRLAALVALFIVGVVLFSAGVAMIYPPAALIVAGAMCIGSALVIEVGDR